MNVILASLMFVLLMQNAFADCTQATSDSLLRHGKNYHARLVVMDQLLNQFSKELTSNYEFLNLFIKNKKVLGADDLDILIVTNNNLIDSIDDLYGEHEDEMDAFGLSEDEGLYPDIVNCVPASEKSILIDAIESYLFEVNIDESTMLSMFDAYYNYSSALLLQFENYKSEVENNKSSAVPRPNWFDPLLVLNSKVASGSECIKDLANFNFSQFCNVVHGAGLQMSECEEPVFKVVKACK